MDEREQVKSEADVSHNTSISTDGALQIKDIVLEKELASGLLATVWKGQQTLLQRTVAIKILSKKDLEDDSAQLRFQQEASLAANLDHPNIAKVLGYGTSSSGSPYLTMEFVDGITLREFLDSNKQQPQSLKHFGEIFLPLLSALSYAHGRGIVHRDIKPGNIMLTKSANDELMPKLVDFGIAKVFIETNNAQHHTKTGTVIGTPAYMSPEQCLGKALDGRSDLYSLACVMYEFLCGEALFKADTPLAVMGMHAQAQLPSEKSFSKRSMQAPKLCGTILSALQKDPEQRPASALRFSDELSNHLKNAEALNYRKQNTPSTAIVASILLFLLTAGIIALVAFPKMKMATHIEPAKKSILVESTGKQLAQLRRDKGASKDQRSILARYLSLIQEYELKRETSKKELAESYSQAGETINIILRQDDSLVKDRKQLEQMGIDFAQKGANLAIEKNSPKFFFRCARNQFEILDGKKSGESEINKMVVQANEHWPASPECIELTADAILNSLELHNAMQAQAFLKLLSIPNDEESEQIRLIWLRSLNARLAIYEGDKQKALNLIKPVLEQLEPFDSGLIMSPSSTIDLLLKIIGPTLIKANRQNEYAELLKKELEKRPQFYGLNGRVQMYGMISETYQSSNEKAKAVEYDEKALELYEQNKDELLDDELILRLCKKIVSELNELNDPKYSAKLAAYKSKIDSLSAGAGTK